MSPLNSVLGLCLLAAWMSADAMERMSGVIPVFEEDEGIIPGEYIVMTKRVEMDASIKDTFPDVDVRREGRLGRRRYAVIRSEEERLQQIAANPLVDYVEPNRETKLIEPIKSHEDVDKKMKTIRGKRVSQRRATKADPECHNGELFKNYTWGVARTSYRDLPSDFFTTPYQYAYDGTGVDVYVMDTGIDTEHRLFTQTGSTRASVGMVADGVTGGDLDRNGHGTHVASTAAGDIFGIALNANIISCKVLGTIGAGSVAGSIQAFEWTMERVRNQTAQGKKPRSVVNMSLGGAGYVQSLYDTIEEASELHIVVVVAAGNGFRDANGTWPASYDNTITVGASDSSDKLAVFSNFGECVDVAAPGVWIWGAHGKDATILPATEDDLMAIDGTSMACPHVAGVVASYLSQLTDEDLPYVSHHSIRDMLQETATHDILTFPFANRTIINRLLYDNCGPTPYDIKNYNPNPNSGRSIVGSSLVIALILVLLIVGYDFS